jgi:hypothetical protein
MRHLTSTEYLELSYRITSTLAESPDPQSAVRDVLFLLCKTLDFDAGGVWVVHDVKAVLRCLSFWSRSVAEFPHFEFVLLTLPVFMLPSSAKWPVGSGSRFRLCECS